MNLLVTGGAGFIGSNFVRLVLQERPDWNVVVLDALTYAGNRSTMADFESKVPFVHARIEDAGKVRDTIKAHNITHIVNFAAESHNDRSIEDAMAFIQSNVAGPYNLLERVREFGLNKMVHVSTDEVYGSIDAGEFTEETPLQPNTPYSASKAGGDLQCRAHHKSYGTPVVVTHGGNTYGPFQYPEKLISFFTVRLLLGKKVPVYGEGNQIREWIHVMDHAAGILAALEHGVPGQVYNVGDMNERTNIWITRRLIELTGKDESLIKFIEDPRKGAHDARYSMRSDRIAELGWSPKRNLDQELEATVDWYRANEGWWQAITSKPEYVQFIQRFYGPGLGSDL